MKRFLVLALTSVAFAAETIIPSAPSKDSDGCYAISTAEELFGFADIVNASETHEECGKLTRDIVVNDYSKTPVDTVRWTPIDSFRGIFDGQNHTITGLYTSDSSSGLGMFRSIHGPVKLYSNGTYEIVRNVVVKNLRLVKSVFRGYDCVGGITGGANNADITNCSVNGVASADLSAGGLVGCSYAAKISRSYNDGFVGGTMRAGGLVGHHQYSRDDENSYNALIIENSYNTGTVSSHNRPGALVGEAFAKLNVFNSFNSGVIHLSSETLPLVGYASKPITVEHSFYVKSRDRDTSAIEISLEGLKDGSVAQRLRDYNKDGVDGSVWGQAIGEDLTPRLTGVFSVKSSGASIVAKTPAAVDGCYQIGSAEELYGFAFIANASLYRTAPVCGKLTKDIVVNENVLKNDTLNGDGSIFVPWKSIKNFVGNFDGAGHTISGLYSKDTSRIGAGLFVSVYNPDASKELKIENVGIEDSYFYSSKGAAALINKIESESGAVTIKNSYSKSYVIGYGGLVGDSYGNLLSIENSYSADKVEGYYSGTRLAGLVSTVDGDVSIVNSYSVADLKSDEVGTLIGYVYSNHKATVVNSYGIDSYAKKKSEQSSPVVYMFGENVEVGFFNVFSEKNGKAIREYMMGTVKEYPISYVNAEQFADGSVATLLHNYSSQGVKGSIWGQKIGFDAYPNFSGSVSADFVLSDLKLVTYSGDTVNYTNKYMEGVVTSLPNPNRKDYTFAGWYKNADFSGEQVKFVPANATGSQTFYAKWWRNPHLEKGCFEIDDEGALYMFAAYVDSVVRNAYDDPALCAKLTADIVVNKNVLVDGKLNTTRSDTLKPWPSFLNYNGVFDGNGHVISGLYGGSGLFGSIHGNHVVIKNLGIVDSYFSGGNDVGGFVGDIYGYSLVIANSYFEGVVKGYENVGGLVGRMENTEMAVISSYNLAPVEGEYDVGGLVGLSEGSLTMMYSYNEGPVKGIQGVGGLVGTELYAYLHLSNSYNVAPVTTEKNVVGGLVGYLKNDSSFIYNSYNLGAVKGTGNDSIGGICSFKKSYVDFHIDSAYYLEGLPVGLGGTAVAAEDFANKNLLKRLQAYKNYGLDGSAWTQSDSDKYPVLNKTVSDAFIDSIVAVMNASSSSSSAESSSSVVSSSSSAKSSSSVAPESSSSANEKSSSSVKEISSSSETKSSSSSTSPKSSSSATPESSSSAKSSLVVLRAVSPVNVRSAGRMVEISGVQAGEGYALMDMQGRLLQRGYASGAVVALRVMQPGRYLIRVAGQVKTVIVR